MSTVETDDVIYLLLVFAILALRAILGESIREFLFDLRHPGRRK